MKDTFTSSFWNTGIPSDSMYFTYLGLAINELIRYNLVDWDLYFSIIEGDYLEGIGTDGIGKADFGHIE